MGTRRTRWAVLGPGAIAQDFVQGLRESALGALHAVGSSDPARAARFAAEHDAPVSGTYDEVLARDDVDAVYVGTVHVTHVATALRALGAGKAVLCEKPMSLTLAGARDVLAAARAAGRPFVEAYKFRFAPHFAALRELVADGVVGRVESVEASFGFAAGARTGRLFDVALGGGAVFDVGCYPVSFAVGVAAAAGVDLGAGGDPGTDGTAVEQVRARLARGVDARSDARLVLGDVTADVRTAIVAPRTRRVRLRGTEGTIVLPDGWGGRARSADTLVVRRRGERARTVVVPVVNPMGAEADGVSRALAGGVLEAPEMTWAETLAGVSLVERWRAAALAAG